MADLICSGPGPHDPPSGKLGTTDVPVTGMRCNSIACIPAPDPSGVNAETLRQQALVALANNRTYLALTSPTAAQTTAQVKAMSRQNNGLIRLLLGQLDGTD